MANTIKLGTDSNWAVKENNLLAYNDENNIFKPIDFEFTRDSGATRVNEQGLIENVSIGVPRIDFSDGKGSLLLEPARTNLLTYSNDFTDASWSTVAGGTGILPVITPNAGISPDGTQNASRLVLDLNGGTSSSDRSGIQGSIVTVENGATTAKTIWIKSNDSNSYDLNLIEGTGGGNTGQMVTALPNTWTRVENVGSVTGTQSRFALSLDNRFGVTVSDTADILIYGAQLEQGSYPTSYIPTSGATATRNAETSSKANISNLINSSEGVLYAEISALADNGTNSYISLNYNSSNSDEILMGYTSSGNLFLRLRSNSSEVFNYTESSLDVSEFNKIAFCYLSGNIKIYLNGLLIFSDNSSFSFSNDLDVMEFSGALGSPFYGKVKDLRVYNQALTDTELIALTQV